MKALLVYCKSSECIQAFNEILTGAGHQCTIYRYDKATLRDKLSAERYDVMLSVDSEPICRLGVQNKTGSKIVYFAKDLYCPSGGGLSVCNRVLTIHPELTLQFITNGARENNIVPVGFPLPSDYGVRTTKDTLSNMFGLRKNRPIFCVYTETVSKTLVCSVVKSIAEFCEDAQIVLFVPEFERKQYFTSKFCRCENVFIVSENKFRYFLLSGADVICTAANMTTTAVCAQFGKILIFLHSMSAVLQKNESFLSERGVGFKGHTAADSVSYACRMLESKRLQSVMFSAQTKFFDLPTERFILKALEEL